MRVKQDLLNADVHKILTMKVPDASNEQLFKYELGWFRRRKNKTFNRARWFDQLVFFLNLEDDGVGTLCSTATYSVFHNGLFSDSVDSSGFFCPF